MCFFHGGLALETAKHRLERTATWYNKLEGGVDYLKQVIIHDSLGICDELEADMMHLIKTYQCEWKATIEDPNKVNRFRHFVNSEQPDPSLVHVEERGQKRPVKEQDKTLVGISQ